MIETTESVDELKAERSHLWSVIEDQKQTIVMLARMIREQGAPMPFTPEPEDIIEAVRRMLHAERER